LGGRALQLAGRVMLGGLAFLFVCAAVAVALTAAGVFIDP
jgi:hypothetical protein